MRQNRSKVFVDTAKRVPTICEEREREQQEKGKEKIIRGKKEEKKKKERKREKTQACKSHPGVNVTYEQTTETNAGSERERKRKKERKQKERKKERGKERKSLAKVPIIDAFPLRADLFLKTFFFFFAFLIKKWSHDN